MVPPIYGAAPYLVRHERRKRDWQRNLQAWVDAQMLTTQVVPGYKPNFAEAPLVGDFFKQKPITVS